MHMFLCNIKMASFSDFTDAIARENAVLQARGSRSMRGAFATLASLAAGETGGNDITGWNQPINWNALIEAVTVRKYRLEQIVVSGAAPTAPEFWRHLSALRRLIGHIECLKQINEDLRRLYGTKNKGGK